MMADYPIPPTISDVVSPFLNSARYGAEGDGVSINDTAAIQRAIDTAKDGTVWTPPGIYNLHNTLTINDVRGLVFRGAGYGTVFKWVGNPDRPMFKVTNSASCVFEDFRINTSPQNPLKNAFWIYTSTAPQTYVSKSNIFRHIEIDGTTDGIVKPVRIGGTEAEGVRDANNDFHIFDHVTIANYSDTAWSLENSQIYNVTFRDCAFQANGRGKKGVDCSAGGNFHWHDGSGSGCTETDFKLGILNNGSNIIDGFDGESSNRFIDTVGPAGSTKNHIVRGVSWRSDKLAADGYAVWFKMPGVLSIRDSMIGHDTSKPLRFAFQNGFTTPYSLSITDSIINSSLQAGQLFVAAQPRTTGSILQSSANSISL